MRITQELETVRGTVEHIVYCNEENGYTVLDVAGEDGALITAVGALSNVNEGEEVVLHGLYKTHANFGEQFRVEAYEVQMPESVAAIQRYLAGGALPYIGKALAGRIVDAFGADSLEVIATQPEKLERVKGLTHQKALAIQTEFKRIFGVREAMEFLARYGLSSAVAISLYKHYGPQTVEIVSGNPYVLCGYPSYVEFGAVDRIAAEMSMEYDSRERMSAGLQFVLRHNLQNGHACLPRNKLIEAVAGFLRIEPENLSATLDDLLEQEELTAAVFEDNTYIFLPDYARAEKNVAEHLRFLAKIPPTDGKGADAVTREMETVQGIHYAPLQKEAIHAALSHHVLVLTGGPGTGKTTTLNAMLAAFEQEGERVALTAPTGRAAKRMAELTGRKATTIHRLLEVDHNDSDTNTVRFLHNQKHPLKANVVVIDEMSMVDVMLFESLLFALKPSCKVIMVGDEDQLPSVGAGNVLGSVMASGVVPVVRLTEVFRQAAESLIVSNAHRIVNGEVPVNGGREDDFFMMECDDPERCVALVCDLVARRLPQAYGFDPMEDIQVLSPTKIGPLGTVSLNAALQQKLNPPAQGKAQIDLKDRILRTGDKVMQMKNNYDIPFSRPGGGEDGAGAFNGDMGIIEHIDVQTSTVTVRSEDRVLAYTSEHLRELEPAYAVTIHKSQGSEFPAILIPLLDVPPRLCYRNLLYTGVTRARQLCVLAGHAREAAQMVHNIKSNRRYSCLARYLRGESE